jgi:3D (Asp-Asp-Asp) domain-containing protein
VLGDRRHWFGGLRLLVTGVAIGLVFSYGTVKYYRHIIVEETRLPKPVIDPPSGMKWVQTLTTGYCPCAICCGLFSDGRTSINRDVVKFPFGIAAEPKLIDYRTMVDVPGYGLAMIDDTGGAMRQSAIKNIVHFDLRFQTHMQARKWGRRWLYIPLPMQSPAAALPELP